MIRKHGVVGKFVEFYGEGMNELSLADHATIANMSPEYGVTMGFFDVDRVTLQYLRLTGRSDEIVSKIESYLRANKMFVDYSEGFVVPKESHNKVAAFTFQGTPAHLRHGDVVITSCTNTSNPSVKPWIKTSLAPGSGVVTKYLQRSGLQKYLNELGFNIVGLKSIAYVFGERMSQPKWIVTRRPLVLQLHKIDEGREYVEFMHLPRKKFIDFVVNVTLVDLPGITKVAVDGQPDTIMQDIENMVWAFIEKICDFVSKACKPIINYNSLKSKLKVQNQGEGKI
ncbi:hypothetical protein JHK85_010477 [Glycine max]|nr:hypothetical protein JHK85_010477 [Glycine max]KAG5066469.1 hypothetical protein JHK86_010200 [Glycine max]